MQWYNIEIFTPDFSYRSSNQTTETEVDIDYLAISNSKVVLPDIRASEGDYIRFLEVSLSNCISDYICFLYHNNHLAFVLFDGRTIT